MVNGAERVYISSRSEQECFSAAEQLNKLSGKNVKGKCIAIPANLSTEQGCIQLVDEMKKKGEDKLHVLINNAGRSIIK